MRSGDQMPQRVSMAHFAVRDLGGVKMAGKRGDFGRDVFEWSNENSENLQQVKSERNDDAQVYGSVP